MAFKGFSRNLNEMPILSRDDLLYIAGAIESASTCKMTKRYVQLNNHWQYVPYLCFYSISIGWSKIIRKIVNDSCNKFTYKKTDQSKWKGRVVFSSNALSSLLEQVMPYLRNEDLKKLLNKMIEMRSTFNKDPFFYNKANQVPDHVFELREKIYCEFHELFKEIKSKDINLLEEN